MAIGIVWFVLVPAALVLVLVGLLLLPFGRRGALVPARTAARGIDLLGRAHAAWARMLLASTIELELAAARSTQLRIVEAGGADPRNGSGLRGLSDRVSTLDGELSVHSPPGQGTVVHAVVALAGAMPAGSA
jgi:glucose dehydrogenase